MRRQIGDLKSEIWFGLLAPRGTLAGITQKIDDAINTPLKTPECRNNR